MKKQTLAELLRAPLCCAALWFSFAATPAGAQTTSTGAAGGAEAPTAAVPSADEEEADETLVVLDPFVVSAEEDAGSYRATSTLAGTRVRTDLKDVASSISVVTAEFLRDTGATNNQTLLQYTTNTEVGGVYGNYGGVGSTFVEGATEGPNFANPNTNTRVRGLNQADNTRDYFLTDIPWDSYIVGRVDLQRGPNSILFGIGSPSGIINSNINTATFRTGGSVENRFDQFGSLRWVLDYNHVLIDDELAVRFSALDDNTKYRQKPAYNHDKRLFGTITWNPSFLKSDSAATLFRANFENGTIDANRPRVLPPWDRITPYFDAGAFNRETYDPYYAWAAGAIGYPSTSAVTTRKNFWLVQYPGPGIQATSNPMFYYDNQRSGEAAFARQAGSGTYWGINTAGVRDGGIDGFPYGSNVGIGSFAEMANNDQRTNGNAFYPGADKGFYKSKSLTDTSIFNFYDNLLDGPNKWETQDWKAYNFSVTQKLLNDRLNINVAVDHQDYDDAQSRTFGDGFISVDVREYFLAYPSQYTDLAVRNPNAGRAFVGGSGSNGSTHSVRDAYRITALGDVRASDFLDDGLLTDILGRHLFTGLYSADDYTRETRNWVRYAVDTSWSDAIGSGSADGGSNSGGLVNGDQRIDTITYLTESLKNVQSPRGLRIDRIRAKQSPHGTYTIPYFDSHWDSTVDPATVWQNPARSPDTGGESTFESENPANYVGYVNGSFNVRNADRGDINRLYTSASKVQKKTTSKALTWQGYLWDDTIVPTFGWRTDKQKQRSGASQASPTPLGVASINPELDPLDPTIGISEETSRSWGVVIHTPRALRDKLPYRSNISLTYSNGRNSSVENRYDFGGNPLPNQKGFTKDMGIVLSMLDDRLQFKATYYETKVKDANISSVTTQASTLGSNTYYLYLLESWGTASALLDLAGREGGAVGWEWYWNWAMVDGNSVPGAGDFPAAWDSAYNDLTSPTFLNHPSTIAQNAAISSWLSQLPEQSWFDAYGMSVNREAAAAGDWRNAIAGWTPTSGVGGVQASGGGRINGSWPTGTVNNLSKGWEFEIVGSPTHNLNVSLNASKTHASQTALGASLVDYIEAANEKYQSPAGDLRLWWGGDATLRRYWNENIWSAYQFQLQTNGKLVPELAPWRANLIMNYSFDQGLLKGTNVGFGYRWQDKRVLGYALNDDPISPNLDVNRPYWSSTEDWLDVWAGYQRQISEKLTWRLQINVRNVGKDPYLSKLSVQPNGQPAMYRINEGMTWQVSNTFSF
mgnify:CR=1 FL=1